MKNLTGQVISTKMQKVATILIEQFRKHPLYGKILKRNFKIHAVNKIGAETGDRVVITETRPVAKTVSFIIKEIVGKKIQEKPVEVEKPVKEGKKEIKTKVRREK